MRDIIIDQGCLTSNVCVDLLIFNVSILTSFSNVIDEMLLYTLILSSEKVIQHI